MHCGSAGVIPAQAGTQATLPQGSGLLLGATASRRCFVDAAPLPLCALGSGLRRNDVDLVEEGGKHQDYSRLRGRYLTQR
jgi:hypothetical protein